MVTPEITGLVVLPLVVTQAIRVLPAVVGEGSVTDAVVRLEAWTVGAAWTTVKATPPPS